MGPQIFLYSLISTKPKHKRDTHPTRRAYKASVILEGSYIFLFSLFGETIGLGILGRRKVMSNEKENSFVIFFERFYSALLFFS